MSVSDMLGWLRSTIEGDKAAAEAATPVTNEDGCHSAYRCWHDFDGTWVNPTDQEHMARQDPQHTIARCEAELTILDQVLPEVRRIGVRLAEEFGGIWHDDRLTPSEKMLLNTLASGYRHRPGFNPDWAVDDGMS